MFIPCTLIESTTALLGLNGPFFHQLRCFMALYSWRGNDLKSLTKHKLSDDPLHDPNAECSLVFVEMVGGRVTTVGVVGASIEPSLLPRCSLDPQKQVPSDPVASISSFATDPRPASENMPPAHASRVESLTNFNQSRWLLVCNFVLCPGFCLVTWPGSLHASHQVSSLTSYN